MITTVDLIMYILHVPDVLLIKTTLILGHSKTL